MIDTKLILIEGPPGSGKSTTARKLAAEISHYGQPCQYFLEWAEDNPIFIGADSNLAEVIARSRLREADVLQQWQQFAQERQLEQTVTVIESRFWQTSVMLMYVVGHSVDEVIESNQRVIAAIKDLQPVLIYFTSDNLRAFFMRTIQLKNAEWEKDGKKGTWEQHIVAAFEQQKWLTDRGLKGLEGGIKLLEEWALVAERLYDRVPFPKIKIRNPHADWDLAMQQMREFLDLAS